MQGDEETQFLFSESEFTGRFAIRDLVAALVADRIEVPKVTSEIASPNPAVKKSPQRPVSVPKVPSEIASLNRLLFGKNLYGSFKGLDLSREAKELQRRSLIPDEPECLSHYERTKLNRLILEAAYPLKCPKKQTPYALPLQDIRRMVFADETVNSEDSVRTRRKTWIVLASGDTLTNPRLRCEGLTDKLYVFAESVALVGQTSERMEFSVSLRQFFMGGSYPDVIGRRHGEPMMFFDSRVRRAMDIRLLQAKASGLIREISCQPIETK
ncbi:MAG: hypothetical protein A2107_14410 [Verrucomicrobia bacterium GWF2_62_7]|nr:MAG: hypothetical protein A2107_14410 [Verrucomicrobia bacterium GWF2_62_7]